MMVVWKWVASMVVLLSMTFVVFAADSGASSEAARDTIAQINHLNWVVSKIKTYNNAIVLEEEYRQISPDKLNLNRIPDKDTLGKILEMLDLLHGMINEEREMREWKRAFEMRRKRQQVEFWRSQVGNAPSAVSGLGWSSLSAGCGAVMSISRSALGTYREYSTMMEDLEDEALRQKFKMETKKLERLHELNKDILRSQWEMIQKYGFDDSLRVSDSDITLFIAALKDADHNHVYSRIEAMRDKFKIFPVYWYYLSSVALETGHPREALEACEKFFAVNRGLFRDDPTVGAVAMNKIYLMEKNDANKDEVQRLLDLVWRHNAGEMDWRKDYFCATVYGAYLKDKDAAVRVLAHAMATLEGNVSEQLHGIFKGDEVRSEAIDFADGESLWMCRKLMAELSAGKVSYDEEGLKALCSKETTSNIDKLDYVGRMTVPRLWEVIGEDVERIRVDTKNTISWKGLGSEIVAEVPVRWLLSGELSARLELLRNDECVCSFEENRQKRLLGDGRMVRMCFDIPRKSLQNIDAVRLSFLHPDYPVALTYASGSPYLNADKASAPGLIVNDGNFNAGKTLDDLRLMIASFQGVSYYRNPEQPGFSRKIDQHDWKAMFAKTFQNLKDYAAGTHAIAKGGVAEVSVSDDGYIKIQYRNDGKEKIRPAVSVYLLNRYGAVIARIDDIWKIKRLGPGEESVSKVFDGNKNATYLDIEVK